MSIEGEMPPGRTLPRQRRHLTRLAHIWYHPLWINDENGQAQQVPLTDIRVRTYRSIASVDGAHDKLRSM